MPIPEYNDRLVIGAPNFTVPVTPSGLTVPREASFAAPAAATTEAAQGLGQLGTELTRVVKEVDQGIQQTKATEALAGFLTDREALLHKYRDDQDYATVEERFGADLERSRSDRLSGITDPQIRARSGLEMTRSAITARSQVFERAQLQQRDVTEAGLSELERASLNDAFNAKTDTERMAAVDRYQKAVRDAADAGHIDQRAAFRLGARFGTELQRADANALMQRDPASAVTLLKDAKNFPALEPTFRQSLILAAQDRLDGNHATSAALVAAYKPEQALLTVGRAASPELAMRIFDKVLVPIESSNNPSAVSSAGALGLAQLMPGTARDMAAKLGLADVSALSDADLKARLLSDTKLNLQLGRAYWGEMVARYDGNLAAAAGAYNAGPGRMDEWLAAAQKKFGTEHPSAAQLASVVDFKETRDYIGKVYARAGAPLDVGFATPGGASRASNAVAASIAQQQGREDHAFKVVAAAAAAADPLDELTQQGLNAAPERVAQWRATQQAAADRGDASAAQRLRNLDFGMKVGAFARQAWAMSPVTLDAAIDAATAAEANSPNVTADQAHMLKAFRAVRDEQHRLRNEAPLLLGEKAGMFAPVALNPSADPDSGDFRRALAERGAQAEQVARVYQSKAIALKPEETRALKERYDAAPAPEKFKIVSAIATLPETVYQDTLRAVVGNDDATAFVGRMARTRPELAREIFDGHALATTEGVKSKAADVRAVLAEKIGGQLYFNPAQQDAVIGAALAVYTARRGRTGALYGADDQGEIGKALADVAGTIVRHNKVRVAAPPGWTEAQFTQAMDRLGNAEAFGGAYDRSGLPFTGDDIRNRAILKQLAPGSSRYLVEMPTPDGMGAPIFTAMDVGAPPAPLVIDLMAMPRPTVRPGPASSPGFLPMPSAFQGTARVPVGPSLTVTP